MTPRPIVVDPGHGGHRRAGRSTPLGHRGVLDLVEKDLNLDVANRLRRRLGGQADVLLTRDGDENLSLGARAAVARVHEADTFLSIHFGAGGGEHGNTVWIHDGASSASRALAGSLANALGHVEPATSARVAEGPFAVLDPRFHHHKTRACLVEMSRLGNPDHASRLLKDTHREGLAQAIARVLRPASREVITTSVANAFDLYYEVPLVYQLTGMSCWAAAAAMIVGWRDCRAVQPEEVAAGIGVWGAYRDGLEPENVEQLANAWGLTLERPRDYSLGTLRTLLRTYGPLWTGEASPGLHVIVIAGMFGDGTPEGTFVRIADPWPVDEGERYTIPFASLARAMKAAGDITGITAQLLHAGDANLGTFRRERVWRTTRSTVQLDQV